jgi:hypothetical protein
LKQFDYFNFLFDIVSISETNKEDFMKQSMYPQILQVVDETKDINRK